MNLCKSFLLVNIFLLNIALAILVFANGFLIRRTSLNHNNTDSYPNLKQFNKAIVLFVDAFRFDFVFTNRTQTSNDFFGVPTMESLIRQNQNSRLFKFIADPPTTTMQRIKALMSGTLPTFIDAGANFNSFIVEDDNLIRQSYLNNKSVIILGDDTWMSLFEETMIEKHYTYPSFNIKDLDSNDLNVNEHIKNILGKNSTHKWNLLIAHFLGIDHCGHSFGPKSPVLKRKLKDIDETIKFVSESIDDDTLLLVIGDHGMTDTGDHGGDSKLELETTLFFYSKKKMFNPIENIETKIKHMLFEEVRQIDFTPTLALALGLPIPFSNLGIPILDLFEQNKQEAIKANFLQMINFINKYKTVASEELVDDDDFKNANSNKSHENLLTYLKVIQDNCRDKWSTFNINHCLIGIFLLILSIVTLLIFLNIINANIQLKLDAFTINLGKTLTIMLAIYLMLAILLNFNVKFSIWILGVLFNLYFIIKHVSILAQILSLKFLNKQNFILLLVYLIPFSNSYIIRENNSLRFLLLSLLFVDFYNKLKICEQNIYKILKNLLYTIKIAFLIRVSEIFYICREEVLTLNCTQTIFSTPLTKNSYNTIFYLLFILFNFICISFVIYTVSKSNRILKLKYTFYIQLFLIFVYYLIQLRLNLISNTELNQNKEWFYLKQLNLYLARANYILFIYSQFIIWNSTFTKSPLKLKNLITSFGLLIAQVSGESILSVWVLIYVLHLYIEYLSSWTYKKGAMQKGSQVDPIMILFMLGYFQFYASGHETIFTHIKWEAGFNGFDGDNNNKLIRLLMACLIIVNTFSSFILCALAIGLIRFIHFGLDVNEKKFNSILKLYLYSSLKVVFSAISVFVLRRHLMVWKIFAPRFCFEVVGFFVACIICNFNLFFEKN